MVSVLCRMTFDFALWSRGAQPILLVCEEAHRYAPGQPGARLRADQGGARPDRQGGPQVRRLAVPGQPAAVGARARILSQCNTTFAFRLTSLRDQEIVRG